MRYASMHGDFKRNSLAPYRFHDSSLSNLTTTPQGFGGFFPRLFPDNIIELPPFRFKMRRNGTFHIEAMAVLLQS